MTMVGALLLLTVAGARPVTAGTPLSPTDIEGLSIDNGVGIEAEYLADIFKPLVRLHTAAEHPGSGLGLTLARKAIVAQNGVIWCESAPGKGSVFHIRMPAAGRPSRTPSGGPGRAKGPRSRQ